MRKLFADTLLKLMIKNKDIYLLLGDLGYGFFDKHLELFPNRVINCGAGEQALTGIAVGLAQEGKIPIIYSITNFLLYRPFEWIRNYINHEKTKVILVGSGRGKDYERDGISHWSEDAEDVMKLFKNIDSYFPEDKDEIPSLLKNIIKENKPAFISLKR